MLSFFPNLGIWTAHSGRKLFIPFFPRENTLYCAARNATRIWLQCVQHKKPARESVRTKAEGDENWEQRAAPYPNICSFPSTIKQQIKNRICQGDSLSHSRKFRTQKAGPGIFFHLFRAAIFFSGWVHAARIYVPMSEESRVRAEPKSMTNKLNKRAGPRHPPSK